MGSFQLLTIFALMVLFVVCIAQPQLPTIPPIFSATIEANIGELNLTKTYIQYYDSINKRARIEVYQQNGTTLSELHFDNQSLHFTFDPYLQTCSAVTILDSMEFSLMFYSNGSFKSAEDLIGIGPSYNTTYLGTASVRGILCDIWRTTFSITTSTAYTNYTSDYYFSTYSWNFSYQSEQKQQLIMMKLQGIATNLSNPTLVTKVVNHTYNYFNFEDNIEDKSIWNIPDYCPITVPQTVPFPTLPTRFRTSTSIVFPNWNASMSMQQYYDQNLQLARVDYNDQNVRVHHIWNLNKQLHWIIDTISGSCMIGNTTVTPDPNWGPQQLINLVSNSGLLTPQQLFNFGENTTETYRGQEVVRGILCDRWDSYSNTSFNYNRTGNLVIISTTISTYFSSVTWNYFSPGQTQIPVRSITRGTISYGSVSNDILVYKDYTNFNIEVPDDVFAVPNYCPTSLNIPSLPTLQNSFSSVVEITDLNQQETVTYYYFWDYQDNIGRIDYKTDSDNYLTRWIDPADGLLIQFYTADGSCEFFQLDPSWMDPPGQLIGLNEMSRFGPGYNMTYMGQAQIRGLQADHWQSISYSPFVVNGTIQQVPITADQYFTLSDQNGQQNLLAVTNRATPDSILYSDFEYIEYTPGIPDQDYFYLPVQCVLPGGRKMRLSNRRGPFKEVVMRSTQQYNQTAPVDYSGYLQSGIAAVVGIFSAIGGIIIGLVIGFVICYFLFIKSIQMRKSVGAAVPSQARIINTVTIDNQTLEPGYSAVTRTK
jgi:hypothetical protein